MNGVAGMSEQTIRRIETGLPRKKRGLDRGRVLELIHIYNIDTETKKHLLNLVEASKKSSEEWGTIYDGISEYAWTHFDLYDSANTIEVHDSSIIPAMLQTERYIDAIYNNRTDLHDFQDPNTAKRFRIARQQDFFESNLLTHATFIVGEAALRCQIGDEETMHEQHKHLLSAGENSRIEILITPFDAGHHHCLGTEFSILGFGDPLDSDTVHLPNRRANRFLAAPSDVEHYRALFEQTRSLSVPIRNFYRDHYALEKVELQFRR